jgi:hypothetical protein
MRSKSFTDMTCSIAGAPLEVLDRATGHQVTLAMVDSATAEIVDLGRLVTKSGPVSKS